MDKITKVQEVSSFIVNFDNKYWNEVILRLTIIGIRYVTNNYRSIFSWKLKDLNTLSRAKRGTTLIKKVKTKNYEVIDAFVTKTKDNIGLLCKEDIIELKNSDIPIMDLISTGSIISKQKITNAFILMPPIYFQLNYLYSHYQP